MEAQSHAAYSFEQLRLLCAGRMVEKLFVKLVDLVRHVGMERAAMVLALRAVGEQSGALAGEDSSICALSLGSKAKCRSECYLHCLCSCWLELSELMCRGAWLTWWHSSPPATSNLLFPRRQPRAHRVSARHGSVALSADPLATVTMPTAGNS